MELNDDRLTVRRSMPGFEGSDEIYPIADDDFRARRGGLRLRFTIKGGTNRITASVACDDLPIVTLVRSK